MPDEKDKADRAASPPDRGTPAPARTAGAFHDPGRSAPRQPATGLGGRAAVPPEPQSAPPVDPAVIAAATAAAVAAINNQRAASQPTPDMDRTVPGGLYLVDGKVVDAWGNEREDPREAEAAPVAGAEPKPPEEGRG